jgi:serine/threonine protein kinase
MEISFRCTSCRAKLGVDVIYAGRSMFCPQCEETITIPNAGIGKWSTLGDFRLIEMIGEGSTGKVYLARQNSMDREVALKVLNPHLSSNPEKLEDFFKEVKIIARLTHPNIVTALHAGRDGEYHYLAMNYIAGGTLEELVDKEGPLREQDALKYIMLCAQALEYAWNKEDILHLDLKPDNIMLNKSGQIKVTDLGIARCLKDFNIDPDKIQGTPAYMSPEQASGVADLDVRSDIFSLGATLYFLLTGKKPFGKGNVKEILERVISDDICDPQEHNEFLAEKTIDLIYDMMKKDRNERVSSWHDLIERFKECLSDDFSDKQLILKKHKTDPRIKLSRNY